MSIPLLPMVLLGCAGTPADTPETPRVPWEGMVCPASPKDGVEPACTGATLTGTVVCADCQPGDRIELHYSFEQDGEVYSSWCAETSLASDGTYTFTDVSPWLNYWVKYSDYVIVDGEQCWRTAYGETIQVCSDPVVVAPVELPAQECTLD